VEEWLVLFFKEMLKKFGFVKGTGYRGDFTRAVSGALATRLQPPRYAFSGAVDFLSTKDKTKANAEERSERQSCKHDLWPLV
jgi:hypothetical protein